MIITLNYEKKPTVLSEKCAKCVKDIYKGSFRFVMRGTGHRDSKCLYWHSKCFFKELTKIMGIKGKKTWAEGVMFGLQLAD
jgi:hypothetical protein